MGDHELKKDVNLNGSYPDLTNKTLLRFLFLESGTTSIYFNANSIDFLLKKELLL